MPSEPAVLYARADGIATVAMNRPEVRNAINAEMLCRLADVWQDINDDASVRAVIFTGTGEQAFCAGADLDRLVRMMQGLRPAETDFDRRIIEDYSIIYKGLLRNYEVVKPIIAAVKGYCVAGGMEMLQATDIRVAAEDARFAIAEVKHALFPMGGSTVRLARQIPFAKAMEILLTGEQFSAAEALRIGLVNKVVPAAEVMREARVSRDQILTYAELLARARRVGRALRRLGLGCRVERVALQPWESGHDHVAIYAYNGSAWLETMFGTLHARAAFVNVNYRYVADELRFVLATSRARAIIYHAAFAPRLAAVRDDLPLLVHLIQVRDDSGHALLPGAVDYEEWLAAHRPHPLDLPYSPDDLYVLFTGGTTGLPKGVLWRHEDVFFNGLGGHIPGFELLDSEEKLRAHIDLGIGGRFLILPPFMHGAGQWSAFNTLHRGGTVVLPDEGRRLDGHGAWRTIVRERVHQPSICGGALAQPLLTPLPAGGDDPSSVRVISSAAAVLSPAVKQELAALLPDGTMFVESIGATESGLQAMSWDAASGPGGQSAYQLRDNSVLLAD